MNNKEKCLTFLRNEAIKAIAKGKQLDEFQAVFSPEWGAAEWVGDVFSEALEDMADAKTRSVAGLAEWLFSLMTDSEILAFGQMSFAE